MQEETDIREAKTRFTGHRKLVGPEKQEKLSCKVGTHTEQQKGLYAFVGDLYKGHSGPLLGINAFSTEMYYAVVCA